jgi:hypothetical protein
MATGVDTLVTDDMVASKGVWSQPRRSPPIAASDIRRWAIATYWPQTPPRIYWDEEFARGTSHGGIVAPPDFNPFAWPAQRPAARAAGAATGPGGRRLTGLNGGQTDTYGVPMRPGDVITARSRLRDWQERQGRFGLMLYAFSELEWRNQDDQFVRLRVSTSIRY